MFKKFFQVQIHIYDKIDQYWDSPGNTKLISNIVVAFFVGGLIFSLFSYFNIFPYPSKNNAFLAIEWAFNALLVFEILGLIFLIPRSVADAVGKQFEIISLILLRDAFKEFGHYVGDIHWDLNFLIELAPIVADAFGAILIFLITGLFYRAQKHVRITQNKEEQKNFLAIKKLLSIYLTLSFVSLGIYDVAVNQKFESLTLFYTLLVFTDIFILLFSLRYTTKYFNLFRYSSFALATIFLRFTLSAPAYFNVLLAVIAGLMVLGVTYIYNKLLEKQEAEIA